MKAPSAALPPAFVTPAVDHPGSGMRGDAAPLAPRFRGSLGRVWFVATGFVAAGAVSPLARDAVTRLRWTGLDRFAAAMLATAAVVAAASAVRAGGSTVATDRRGWVVWLAAASLAAVSILLRSPSLALCSLLVVGAALAGSLFGAAVRRAVLPAWLGLSLALPLPAGREVSALETLRDASIPAAGRILDLAGVRNRVVGPTVETPGRVFESAGGGRAAGLSLASAVLLAAALRRGVVWSVALLIAAVFAAGVSMSIAAALPILFAFRDGPDLSTWPAAWPGLAVFGGTFLFTWSADRTLSWLMPRGGAETWRAIRVLVTGGPLLEDEPFNDPVAAVGRPRSSLWPAAAFSALFIVAAGLWLLPPHWSDGRDAGRAAARAAEGGVP